MLSERAYIQVERIRNFSHDPYHHLLADIIEDLSGELSGVYKRLEEAKKQLRTKNDI